MLGRAKNSARRECATSLRGNSRRFWAAPCVWPSPCAGWIRARLPVFTIPLPKAL